MYAGVALAYGLLVEHADEDRRAEIDAILRGENLDRWRASRPENQAAVYAMDGIEVV